MSDLASTINRTFLAAEVAALTGASPKDIQNWVNRGVMVGHRIGGGGGKGKRREFTFQNVMAIAVAKAFLEGGVGSLKLAFDAADQFAHFGDDPRSGNVPREPGFPHHHDNGQTYIIAANGLSDEFIREADGSFDFYSVTQRLGQVTAFAAVDATNVFAAVCHSLGLDYRVVLDAAYPEGRR